MSHKNILITGATGFIGSEFIKLLDDNKYNIYVLSRSTEFDFGKNVTIIKTDLSGNFSDVLPSKIEIIFHLAQSKLYKKDLEEAKDIFNINTLATFRLLEFAKNNNVKKFIYASSGSVYGISNEKYLFTENDKVISNNIYAASKIAAENLALAYSNAFDVKILRFFTPYGKNQDQSFLIPKMIENIKNQNEIKLTSQDGPYLTPTHISDICKILAELILKNIEGNIFNISGDEVLSLKKIVNIIATNLDIKTNLSVSDGDKVYVCGDNGLLKTAISNFTFSKFEDSNYNTF